MRCHIFGVDDDREEFMQRSLEFRDGAWEPANECFVEVYHIGEGVVAYDHRPPCLEICSNTIESCLDIGEVVVALLACFRIGSEGSYVDMTQISSSKGFNNITEAGLSIAKIKNC